MWIDGNGNMVSAPKTIKTLQPPSRYAVLNRRVGNVFATQFTLGGELTSTRFFQGTDSGELSAFKDSVKIAAGLSISSPVASGGGSIASSEGNKSSQGEEGPFKVPDWHGRLVEETLYSSRSKSQRSSTYPFYPRSERLEN